MTGQDYVNNKALHPFWDASRDPNKEDVADAYEQGKADGWKEFEKQKQDAPEGLEEAAEKYTNDSLKNLGAILRVNIINAFKAGAKWDRAKMMEKAVGGRYMKAYSKVYVESWPLDIDPDSVKAGDEVRLIVIPEEKVK